MEDCANCAKIFGQRAAVELGIPGIKICTFHNSLVNKIELKENLLVKCKMWHN